MIHLPAKHVWDITDWDIVHRIGSGVPVLGFSFYKMADWQRLYTLGFREAVVRLWHDWGTLPEPQDYLDGHSPTIDALLAMGWKVATVAVNEPNMETRPMGASGVRDWHREYRLLSKARYPQVEIVSPALSQNGESPWQWLETVRDEWAECDSIGVHFYWARLEDAQSGAGWSPEWYRGQFPDKPQRITECGGGDDTTMQWRYATYPLLFKRWLKHAYVKSIHPFILSAEDPQWTVKGHVYDAKVVEIICAVTQVWRTTRVQQEDGMPEFVFGFKDLHDAHPQEIGEAISAQVDLTDTDGDKVSLQMSANGLLVWTPAGAKFFRATLP